MYRLTEFVARLKAWQVFLALLVPMVGAQIYLMTNMLSFPAGQQPDIGHFEDLVRRIMLSSLLMVFLVITWSLSIALVANRRIDPKLRPSSYPAIGCAAYVAGYMVLAQFVWPSPNFLESEPTTMLIVFPLHFLATAAMFYVLVFSAKNIAISERQSTVSFFDYSGPFFLIWFFPVGVWFVQPRVNQIASTPAK